MAEEFYRKCVLLHLLSSPLMVNCTDHDNSVVLFLWKKWTIQYINQYFQQYYKILKNVIESNGHMNRIDAKIHI